MKKLPSDLFEINEDVAKELGVDSDFDTSGSVLVVTGQNASGKSFLRRLLHVKLKQMKIEVIVLSQEGRTSGGVVSAMVYGDESRSSTGSISCQTFISGIHTSRSRQGHHVLIWDEPEIGMGEELQLGSAQWLFRELSNWPKNLQGVILLTHSRHFVREAMKQESAKWFSLDGYKTAESWLKRKIKPAAPDVLAEDAVKKFRKLIRMLSELKD